MLTDLELAFKALRDKQRPLDRFWNYYTGDQPLAYTARRLESIFRGMTTKFNQNWCEVAIDACNERINLRGFAATDPQVQTRLQQLFTRLNLSLESDDVHLAMQVTGEAYVIAWRTAPEPPLEGEGVVEVEAQFATRRPQNNEGFQLYYNDPRLVTVRYDADDPRRKLWAAKWWTAEDATLRLNLYYPERVEHYASKKKAVGVTKAADLLPYPDADTFIEENPYGEVPVFHFRISRAMPRSDLRSLTGPQDAVNKLAADHLVASEFSALRQRVVITQAEVTGKIANAPDQVLILPAGDGQGQNTEIGEFSETDLKQFLESIDSWVNAVSAISRTPKHYFVRTGEVPSGEALLAMEAPLVRKAQDRIDRVTPTWREVAAFLLWLDGTPVEEDALTPLFDDPRTIQPLTEAQVIKAQVEASLPLETALRETSRWDEARLEKMRQDQGRQRQAETRTLADALVEQERRARQNADPDAALEDREPPADA